MARYSLKNPFISIGGEDFSSDVSQVMLDIQHTGVVQSITAGNDWAENTPSGKGMWTLTVTFESDGFDNTGAAEDLEKKLADLLPAPIGTATAQSQPVIIRPDSAAVGMTNPQWTGNAVLSNIQPFGSGQVGQVVRFTQTWVGDGALTKTTS